MERKVYLLLTMLCFVCLLLCCTSAKRYARLGGVGFEEVMIPTHLQSASLLIDCYERHSPRIAIGQVDIKFWSLPEGFDGRTKTERMPAKSGSATSDQTPLDVVRFCVEDVIIQAHQVRRGKEKVVVLQSFCTERSAQLLTRNRHLPVSTKLSCMSL